jgi:hypothetical protein
VLQHQYIILQDLVVFGIPSSGTLAVGQNKERVRNKVKEASSMSVSVLFISEAVQNTFFAMLLIISTERVAFK